MIKLFSLKDKNMLSGFNAFKFAFLLIIISPIFSSFLFLYALCASFSKNYKSFFKDNWNKAFVFAGLLMILSLIKNSIFNSEVEKLFINMDAWLDLFNWIPFFLIFYFFQEYLSNFEKRREVALYFLIGSFPLLIIGLSQAWFNLPGIYFTLWGTLNFVEYNGDFITGVFNNPNINGLWLGLMLPFALFIFKSLKTKPYIKIIFIFIITTLVISIFFTYSRLAIISLFIGSLVIINKKKLAIFTIFFSIPIISINFLKIFSEKLVDFFILGIYPLHFIKKLSFSLEGIISSPRLKIWLDSIEYISQKPFFGWGPTNFTKLYELNNSEWFGHAHNLPLQIALNYGIVCSLIITCTILIIMQKCFMNLFINKNYGENFYIDKAWFLATLIVVVNHIFDIQYYDGRISLMSWILLAGLKNILDENRKTVQKLTKNINYI